MPKGDIYSVTTTTTDILAHTDEPQTISNDDSQLLFGESFEAIEDKGEWIYGCSLIDGYKGHVKKEALSPEQKTPSHIIDVPLTHTYPAPSFKTRPLMPLSFLSRITIEEDEPQNGFAKTTNGWIYAAHITPLNNNTISAINKTPLEIARAFLGTPYIYGGRSASGIDCSGLVQLALLRCGHTTCPRDSKDQSTLGTAIDFENRQSGDLVFFPGHVGILTDKDNILNATARTMDTRTERLQNLINHYGEITAIRRV